jgi:16S rRNA (adenine1518-N6/adenine1519-N6)-dimethyltransferase
MSVRTTLDARGLRPQKKWGQHFLTDARILESIADAAEVNSADTILEIGPGLGHLTRILARRAGRVIAVEIDAELAAHLRDDFVGTSNVAIAQGNFMDAAPSDWILRHGNNIAGAGRHYPAPVAVSFKVVANLPYYITSAILRHILEAHQKPSVIVVMVQRQVAKRIVALPPAMSLLAVSVQFFAQPRIMRTIAAGAFYPPPKVDSAVVRMDVFPEPRAAGETARFFEIARAGFGEKRKQLYNSLKHGLPRDAASIAGALASARIDPTRRAETLTIDEWIALSRALA